MKPYVNYTNTELKELLIQQHGFTNAPDYIIDLIEMAFQDSWNPVMEFDGCTVVEDFTHPDVACFIHDWLWVTGKGGEFSNKLFYKLMRWGGMSKQISRRRYIAVKLAWNFWFRFKKRLEPKFTIKDVKYKMR